MLSHGDDEAYRLTSFQDQGLGANGADVSADGRRMVFQLTRKGNYDLYIMDLPRGEPRPLETHPAFEVLPKWSPDGLEIAFMSTRGLQAGDAGPFPGHVYIKNIETGNVRQLTRQPLGSSLGPSDWSPDGKNLLIARRNQNSIDVYTLAVKDGAETRITTDAANEYSASFSSDGRQIAFHADNGSESHIVLSNIDGSGRRQLTKGPGFRYYPGWSPDNKWIIYSASYDGDQYDLRAVPASGGEEIIILATPEDEREAVFVPRQPQ